MPDIISLVCLDIPTFHEGGQKCFVLLKHLPFFVVCGCLCRHETPKSSTGGSHMLSWTIWEQLPIEQACLVDFPELDWILANQDYRAKMGEFRIAYPNDGTWAAGPFQVGHKLLTSMSNYAIWFISPCCLLIPHSHSNHFPFFTRKFTSNENMSTNSSSPSPFDDQTPHLWPHGCWIIYVYDSRSSPHLWMRHTDLLTGCFVDLSTLGSLSPKPHACHALIEQWDSKTSHPAPIQSDIHLDQCAKAWRHVCLGKIRK